MITQVEFKLNPRRRGFHLITDEIMNQLPPLPKIGVLHLFIKHTSAGLTLNENADPSVLHDLNNIFKRLVKDDEPFYTHIYEGSDDMSAHAKSILVGANLTIPISSHCLNLGVWQGIYLCEFRTLGGPRNIVATILC